MVVNVPEPAGSARAMHWVDDVEWTAYGIVWRLHVVDQLNQADKVLAGSLG
jgi:hypothetical protein